MAKKKKVSQTKQWGVVLFGAFIFVGLGLGLLTAFKAGATAQLNSSPAIQNVNYVSH